MDKIKFIKHNEFKSVTISTLYEINNGLNGLENALQEMINEINKALTHGANIIILSDRGVSPDLAPIPMLLATSHTHHAFKRLKKRSKFGIIIESAEPREPHHFSLLFGYGASAINPYLVNEIISYQSKKDNLIESPEKAIDNFNKAIAKGIIKVMNKIGISTLHSYRGAQINEALGLSKKLIDKFFSNTPTRIEGIGLYEIEKETSKRHSKAYIHESNLGLPLEIGGDYRWRRDGEAHVVNPSTIASLQQAVRQNKPESYNAFSKMINDQNEKLMTLRGLFEFSSYDPVPIDQVEPWTEIVKRFKTGAMSLGSISQEAHENLAIAMNRIGGKSNSGEGGEDPKFIARRLLISASEDIGNANPTALIMANSCFEAVSKIGWPESRIILSQCAIYLASSAKSNAAYEAIGLAQKIIKSSGDLSVPLHLRNAPTKLMKELGYGKDYAYSHTANANELHRQEFLPKELEGKIIYKPKNNQREQDLKKYLNSIWKGKYGY